MPRPATTSAKLLGRLLIWGLIGAGVMSGACQSRAICPTTGALPGSVMAPDGSRASQTIPTGQKTNANGLVDKPNSRYPTRRP